MSGAWGNIEGTVFASENSPHTIKSPRLISSKAFRAFYDGGHYSLVNNVRGGQYSLVNNVRGDSIHSDTGLLRSFRRGPCIAVLTEYRMHSEITWIFLWDGLRPSNGDTVYQYGKQ